MQIHAVTIIVFIFSSVRYVVEILIVLYYMNYFFFVKINSLKKTILLGILEILIIFIK